MPCVHYKFQSKLTHETLPFEGLHITVRELKLRIMRRERLKLCDLQISGAQTQEEYTDDAALIPNNTSVVVRRIPSAAGLKSSYKRFMGNRAEPSGGSSKTTENRAGANASEEDKIKAVMYQSSLCYYSSSDAMKLLGLLPPNYICFRCGIPGHHIKNCPTIGDECFAPRKRMRKSTGIPRSFLVEVDDPGRKGVMMDHSGKYVIPIMDAYQDGLLESDGHVCPSCGQPDVSPWALTANTLLRQEVDHFRNGTRPSCSYQGPNSSCRSQSPVPASSSERGRAVRGKRARSRSPLARRTDQKRPRQR